MIIALRTSTLNRGEIGITQTCLSLGPVACRSLIIGGAGVSHANFMHVINVRTKDVWTIQWSEPNFNHFHSATIAIQNEAIL